MPGLFPNDSRALYICGTTICVTAVTAFVSQQVRLQWIHYIEARRIRKADGTQNFRKIENILGIGSYSDYFYYWGTTVTFLFASLSTAAIVTALTPSLGFKNFSTTVQLTPGALPCTTLSANPSALADNISWKLGNESFINYQADAWNSCLADTPFSLLNKISTSGVDKDGYAYTISGIGVMRSSIGVPYDAHNGPAGFDQIFWNTGILQQDRSVMEESTQCLPVFTVNPAKCRRAGKVVTSTNNITVVLDKDCSASTPIYGADLSKDGASAAGYCTNGRDVGKITYIIGSINEHAEYLASAVADYLSVGVDSYAVACDIDIEPAVQFLETTISRVYRPPDESSVNRDNMNIRTMAEFTVESSEDTEILPTCGNASYVPLYNPENQAANVLTAGALAVGAGAAGPLFSQNKYNTGFWDALARATLSRNSTSYAFGDSKNPLEDVLGMVAAISVGQYVGSAQQPVSTRETPLLVNRNGFAQGLGYRIGSGNRWGLIFIAPEAWVILVLLCLLVQRLRL
ncbi:hypothetical protein AA313_de0200011 [Arthrobotrys entomopaga]|nr:hypothetical protein AA313_de0200011 [Arthrobotrys entomopaga]